MKSITNHATLAALLCATWLLPAGAAGVSADDARKVATQVCAGCHGLTGVSVSPMFPRLAGQQELYLVAQLRAFREKSRAEKDAHDYMWGMATMLDESMIEPLGKYFAGQTPGRGIAGDPALTAQGKKLYESGVPAREISACASCHGETAQGQAVFPRLAGQHSVYIIKQLNAIQLQLRSSPVMHGIIKDLTPDEMKAVAEYVQSL